MPKDVKEAGKTYLYWFPMLLDDGSPSGANACGEIRTSVADAQVVKMVENVLEETPHRPKLVRVVEVVQKEVVREVFPKRAEPQVTDADRVKEFMNFVVCAMPHLAANGRYPAFQRYAERIRDAKTSEELAKASDALKA